MERESPSRFPQTEEPWRPSHDPRAVALTVVLPTFMVVLDTSVANVSLPYVAGTLSASTHEATWMLTSYLVANQGSAKYLVAVQSSNEADSLILATNKPVMALGGFSGSDPILTTDELTSLVRAGVVRFFLVRSGGFGQPPRALGPGGQNGITSWVTQNCTPVSVGASGYGGQLYDCQPTGS